MDDLNLIEGLQSLSPEEAMSVINDLPFAYYRANTEGHLIATSQAMVEIFGFNDASELIGLDISDYYVDPSGRERFMQAMQAGHGRVNNFEAEMRGRKGTFWVATSAQWVFDDKGNVIGLEGLTRDITKQRETFQSLQRDAEFFDAFARSAGIGLGIHTASGDEVFVNDTMHELVGLKRADVGGAKVYDRLSPDIARIGMAADREVLSGRVVHQQEALIEIGGQQVWRSFSKFLIHRDEGEEPLICTTVQDVQARKMQEAQLIQSSKLASIGELAAGIAHEINQPLNAIRLTSANLRNHMKKSETLDPKADLAITKVNQQIDRASNIISQLLLYGRDNAGSDESSHLHQVFDNVQALVEQTLKVEDIRLAIELPSATIRVRCSLTKAEQVFMNLITNSRHAIMDRRNKLPRGERLEGQINIAVTPQADVVCIQVRDNGTGIDPESREKILEPFVTTKKAGQGTGLGLSVSLGILRDAGGTLDFVDSDIGACAQIILPVITTTPAGS